MTFILFYHVGIAFLGEKNEANIAILQFAFFSQPIIQSLFTALLFSNSLVFAVTSIQQARQLLKCE